MRDNILKRSGNYVEFDRIGEYYMEDFIKEILEHLDSVKLELVNLEVDPANTSYIDAISRNFHSIKELLAFFEENLATYLIEETLSFVGLYRENNIPATRKFINILLQTILLLRKLCKKESITDEKLQGQVEQHIVLLKQFNK